MSQTHFKMNIDKILGHLSKSGNVVDDNVRSLFFGDYMNLDQKVYDEVTDLKELTSVMEQWVLHFSLTNIVLTSLSGIYMGSVHGHRVLLWILQSIFFQCDIFVQMIVTLSSTWYQLQKCCVERIKKLNL